MKKIFFAVLLMAGFTFGASAQLKLDEKDVPSQVLSSFKTNFPNAKDIEWKKKDNKFKVEFEIGNDDHIAAFDGAGKLLMKGVQIRFADMPAAVATAAKSVNRKLDDVYKIEKDGVTLYKVEFEGKPEKTVIYSADGQEVKEK